MSLRRRVEDDTNASVTSESSSGDENEWLDAEPDSEEPQAIVSLLDDDVFTDVKSMLDHCKKTHNFDFLAVRKQLGLDFYGMIKLVNFVRQRTHDGLAPPSQIKLEDFQDDRFLKPVIDDDALILSLEELEIEDDLNSAPIASSEDSVAERNAQLSQELQIVKEQFANYRLAVEQTLDKRWGDDASDSTRVPSEKTKDPSQYYWESYAGNDIHETMLKDTVRTDAYRDFVYENKHLFVGKTVLDIGCGTGILSMFCAKAGAKAVIAVDKSDIIDKARENIFKNGLSNVITCIRGRIEDIPLPVDKVDIIISEWMGYCLTFEAMLPSVLYARDKYLKPDGLLVPSYSSIWVAPAADPEFVNDHISFWNDVYGFDMTAMQAGIYDHVYVDVFPASAVSGSPCQIAHFDLHTIKAEDLNFRTSWQSVLDKDVDSVDGILVWFDIFFTKCQNDKIPENIEATPKFDKQLAPTTFTTGPSGTATHWKQGLLHFNRSRSLTPLKAGTQITGKIVFEPPADQPRALDITASWSTNEEATEAQTWRLR